MKVPCRAHKRREPSVKDNLPKTSTIVHPQNYWWRKPEARHNPCFKHQIIDKLRSYKICEMAELHYTMQKELNQVLLEAFNNTDHIDSSPWEPANKNHQWSTIYEQYMKTPIFTLGNNQQRSKFQKLYKRVWFPCYTPTQFHRYISKPIIVNPQG